MEGKKPNNLRNKKGMDREESGKEKDREVRAMQVDCAEWKRIILKLKYVDISVI